MPITTASGSSAIAIPALHSPATPSAHTIFSGKTNHQSKEISQLNFFQPLDCKTLQICTARQQFGGKRSIRHTIQRKSASSICQAALDARCVALQALCTVERQTTLSNSRIKGEMKAPMLNDNGPRLPPRGGGGPGGGGGGGDGRGGGGGYWYLYGGFFLLLFLAFLTHLKNQEEHI